MTELTDAEKRRANAQYDARARQIIYDDLRRLSEDEGFARWFGKHAAHTLFGDLKTTNGGDLQHFMGRRQLCIQIVEEMERTTPGFMARVLRARDEFEQACAVAAQKEK